MAAPVRLGPMPRPTGGNTRTFEMSFRPNMSGYVANIDPARCFPVVRAQKGKKSVVADRKVLGIGLIPVKSDDELPSLRIYDHNAPNGLQISPVCTVLLRNYTMVSVAL